MHDHRVGRRVGIADSDGVAGGLGAPTSTSCGLGDADDMFASFSNFGKNVDIAAVGECVASTAIGAAYGGGSGTSFATPAVAGAAALYVSTHPGVTPAKVRKALIAAGEPGPITGDPDTFPEPVLNVSGL
jgi:subtilisin